MPGEDDYPAEAVGGEAVGGEAVEARGDEAAIDEDFIGDCREDVPYGEVFYVMVDGKQYMSCTHTPPHMHPVD